MGPPRPANGRNISKLTREFRGGLRQNRRSYVTRVVQLDTRYQLPPFYLDVFQNELRNDGRQRLRHYSLVRKADFLTSKLTVPGLSLTLSRRRKPRGSLSSAPTRTTHRIVLTNTEPQRWINTTSDIKEPAGTPLEPPRGCHYGQHVVIYVGDSGLL